MIESAMREQLRELLGGDVFLLSVPADAGIPSGDDASSRVRWHQLAVEGEWDGHFQGAFKLDKRTFEEMILNRQALRTECLVDYEHNSLNPFAAKAIAAGWVEELQIRETDQGHALFGRVNWTEAAAGHIKAREYRYLSPTIVYHTRDRKSGQDRGASLHSVALTNVPFLDELPELRLNRAFSASRKAPSMDAQELTQLQEALGLDAKADLQACIAAAQASRKREEQLAQVTEVLGTQGAKPEEVLRAARALRESTQTSRQLGEKVTVLEQELGVLRKERIATMLSEATKEGKIVASNKAWAESLAERDPQAFSDWVKVAPVVVPVKPPGQAVAASAATGDPSDKATIEALVKRLPEEDRKMALSVGVSFEEYVRGNFDDLQHLL